MFENQKSIRKQIKNVRDRDYEVRRFKHLI
jgi:hypothetical protein